MKNKLLKLLPLIAITLFGALLRFWKLGDMPPSLNWDEVSHGYNAYSILKTGRDEWGVFLPHIFRAFGDYKLPVYIYATVVPVFLFGLNAFAVRFISALAGTLAIPGIYLFTHIVLSSQSSVLSKNNKNLTSDIRDLRSKNAALVAAFLLAISPWHFFTSRPALEANLALTFLIYGGYFLLRYFQKTSSLLPSAILFSLALHTYNTARVFVPLLLVASFLIFRKNAPTTYQQPRTKNLFGLALLLLSFSLIVFQVLSGEGTARYKKLEILSENTVFQIGQDRTNSKLPPAIARLVHNRPVYLITTLSKNYLDYFSPQFFFQNKGAHYQFAIPGQNLLTIPGYILFIIGFILLAISAHKEKPVQLLFAWLLISPVAAALTLDPPQALRPNPMIPITAVLIAYSINRLKKWLQIISVTAISIYFITYSYNYWNLYPKQYSQSWQYGYYQAMDFIRFYYGDFNNFFVTKRLGEPHIFYSFYTKVDPKTLQPGGDSIRFSKSDWFWTDKINKVYFLNDWEIPTQPSKTFKLESGGLVDNRNSILITSLDHVPSNSQKILTINYLDGTPAFIIVYIP